jgi:hypothetical protein
LWGEKALINVGSVGLPGDAEERTPDGGFLQRTRGTRAANVLKTPTAITTQRPGGAATAIRSRVEMNHKIVVQSAFPF